MSLQALLVRLHRWRLVRRWRATKARKPILGRQWWITYTPSRDGTEVVAWATDRPTPPDATIASMLYWKGEAHFAFGATIEEARAQLESELP